MAVRVFIERPGSGARPGIGAVADAARARRRSRFPNVVLVTHHGARVRFYDDLLENRTVVVSFLYTRCAEQCPLTIHCLGDLQRLFGPRLGRDLFIYSITIDPEYDTEAVLRAYAKSAGAARGWLFLTGGRPDIERIRASFGDDPALAADRSNHLNLITYGVEPLERWGGLPAWAEAETMARYIMSIEGRTPGA